MILNCIFEFDRLTRLLQKSRLESSSLVKPLKGLLVPLRAIQSVSQSIISPNSSLHNLGVILRFNLSTVDRIRIISFKCYHNLRRFRLIRTSLSNQALRDAAYVFVLSRPDYCNVLYVCGPDYLVRRHQTLANTAAWVVSDRSRFSPVTGYVRNVLYWLPEAQMI